MNVAAEKTDDDRLTYTAKEAFARLGIGSAMGWKLIGDGTIKTIRLGRRVLVPKDALHSLVSDQSKQRASP